MIGDHSRVPACTPLRALSCTRSGGAATRGVSCIAPCARRSRGRSISRHNEDRDCGLCDGAAAYAASGRHWAAFELHGAATGGGAGIGRRGEVLTRGTGRRQAVVAICRSLELTAVCTIARCLGTGLPGLARAVPSRLEPSAQMEQHRAALCRQCKVRIVSFLRYLSLRPTLRLTAPHSTPLNAPPGPARRRPARLHSVLQALCLPVCDLTSAIER